MRNTVVVLVHGEVIADEHGSTIPDQVKKSREFADNLLPLLASNLQVVVMHGNKPQVGFVLFRSEIASHALHPIPLDVCGADTQGATGYMLSQAINNTLQRGNINRKVVSLITQTVVAHPGLDQSPPFRAVGPWFDRIKADIYRQSRGWMIVEEPGRGYRRSVPCLPAIEILEFETIQHLAETGTIVIAAGGGGIPVFRDEKGQLFGMEAVVETESVAGMVAAQLQARVLMMVIEKDTKFTRSNLSTEKTTQLTLEQLEELIKRESFSSRSVLAKLQAAARFLRQGGDEVIITTLRKLPETLSGVGGLRIGSASQVLDLDSYLPHTAVSNDLTSLEGRTASD
jgi:carbamate kinase